MFTRNRSKLADRQFAGGHTLESRWSWGGPNRVEFNQITTYRLNESTNSRVHRPTRLAKVSSWGELQVENGHANAPCFTAEIARGLAEKESLLHSKSSVMQALLKLCSDSSGEGSWAALPSDCDVRRGPEFPTACLSQLIKEFTEYELLAAGVARRSDCGEGLLPAPSWSKSGSVLVALRSAAAEEPFDIFSDYGALTGAAALRSSLEDSSTSAAVDEQGFLLVASSIQDLVVLRSAGLPVTLADGILPLDRHKLETFYSSEILRQRSQVGMWRLHAAGASPRVG